MKFSTEKDREVDRDKKWRQSSKKMSVRKKKNIHFPNAKNVSKY